MKTKKRVGFILIFILTLSLTFISVNASNYRTSTNADNISVSDPNRILGFDDKNLYDSIFDGIYDENSFEIKGADKSEIRTAQSNSLESLSSLEINVLWPEEGYYYITDYFELAVETNNAANCEYNFENSGFVKMNFNNGNVIYDYLYRLQDNMNSEEPYDIIFRCRDNSGTEVSTSTYFWISVTDLNTYFLRQDIAGWRYLASDLSWEGNDNGLLQNYRSTYNKSTSVYSGLSVLIFDNPSSIQGFLDNAVFGFFNNISVIPINGYKVYNFEGEFGDKYVLWTKENYVISSSVYLFENSTPIKTELPIDLIKEYLKKYPSDVKANITIGCFTNNECNDNNAYTFDKCENAGDYNSKCAHQAIRCLKNSDCGNTSVKKFCSNDNLCTNTTTFSCTNPGTVQATCSSSVGQSCNNCQFGCNNQILSCKATPVITVYFPTPINYNITKIPFNLTIGNYSFSEISYIDQNQSRPKWTSLCKNCNEYGLNKKTTKSFKDGFHNITFKAVNGSTVITKNITFLIDSNDPKISSILPKSKSFTNGSDFYIKYTEDNCKSLNLMVNNVIVSGVNSSCTSGKNIERFIDINLNPYNNQEIEYRFILKDKSDNIAESKKTKAKVDTTKPVINSFVNITNRKKVTFTLNITELNFEEVNYIDHSDSRPKEKTLCSKLKDGICSTTKTFKLGEHNITINVSDKAGNIVQKNTKFIIH